jgi:hypothetical protein
VKWHTARKVPGLIAGPTQSGPGRVADHETDQETDNAADEASAGESSVREKTRAAAPPPVDERAARPPAPRRFSPDTPVGPPEIRIDPAEQPHFEPPARPGRRAAFAVMTVLLVAAAVWGAIKGGLLDPESFLRPTRTVEPRTAASEVAPAAPAVPNAGGPLANEPGADAPPAEEPKAATAAPESATASPLTASAADGLPESIAVLPAVTALKRNDPAAFDRFVKRFAIANTGSHADDEMLSLARAALRKSVKRQLANAPGSTLLEITDVYLGYMQGLQSANPESCVALSDEGKGAKLTSNLARAYPALFGRDMAVLEAAGNITATGTPALTAEQARPYLETVFSRLRQQPLQIDLLSRDKIAPADFLSYCNLVIAFYQAVRGLPEDDAVKLLRYLYATAAADPDDEPAK